MKRLFVWGGALALLGVIVRQAIPARLLDARVTSMSPGHPPIANVVLRYGAGADPSYVIVDVVGPNGSCSSATVEGRRLFLEVPLVAALSAGCQVDTTATYRVLGWPYTVVRRFPALLLSARDIVSQARR
jgi:hypothetical protein